MPVCILLAMINTISVAYRSLSVYTTQGGIQRARQSTVVGVKWRVQGKLRLFIGTIDLPSVRSEKEFPVLKRHNKSVMQDSKRETRKHRI